MDSCSCTLATVSLATDAVALSVGVLGRMLQIANAAVASCVHVDVLLWELLQRAC